MDNDYRERRGAKGFAPLFLSDKAIAVLRNFSQLIA